VVSIKLRQKGLHPSNSTAANGRFSYTILRGLMTDKGNEIKQSPRSRLQSNDRSFYLCNYQPASLALYSYSLPDWV
jgi:hypothetical protein